MRETLFSPWRCFWRCANDDRGGDGNALGRNAGVGPAPFASPRRRSHRRNIHP